MNAPSLRLATAALAAALALVPGAARAAPTAQCDLSLPSGPLLSADLVGSVTLTPTANDPIGFQPAIELVLPPEVSYRAGSAVYDVGGPLVASAPIVVPSSGVVVNPYTGQAEDLVGANLARPGDTYLLLRYPLSNLASSAPAARTSLTLAQNGGVAAVGIPFQVNARCLYLLGATPVNDVSTDPPLQTATTDAATVTPQLVRVEVAATNPQLGNSHTVTGPTSPLDLAIRVYVAEGQTVQGLTVTEDVDARLQLVGTPIATAGGAATPASEPVTQGGQVSATWSTLTGPHSGPAATVTFHAYVAEFDDGNPTAPVLPADGRTGGGIPGRASITTYTVGDTLVDTVLWSNVATIVPHGALVAEAISPDPSIPGQSVTVTEEVRVSDYRSFAPTPEQGANTLHVELDSGIQYTGATGVVTVPLTCDAGAAVQSALVDAVITPPATAAAPTTLDLVLPALAGAGASPGPAAVTTACRVALPATILPTYGEGGAPVYSSDVIPTRATLGTVVDDGGAGLAAAQTEADAARDASVHIRSFHLAKQLLDGGRYVDPGETITWDITGDVYGGATDASSITDFLPAPIFDVTELGAGGQVGAAGSGAAVRLDSDTSTFLQSAGITYTTDARTNSITFSVPQFPFQGTAQRVRFLVALTVQHKPADDRLTYVNLVAGTQRGTLTYRTSAAAAAAFAVNEPKLAVHHGVTAALAGAAPVFTPALPAFAAQPPGPANLWSSDALAAGPVASSVSGVDAGDALVLAAVLENTGNAPAYGVAASVTVPAAYGPPSVVSLTDGAGNPIVGATAIVAGSVITVSVPSIPAIQPSSGANVVVLRYGVPVDVRVQAQEVLDPAVLALSAYTSVDAADAPSFVGTPLTASANATIRDLTLAHAATWPSPSFANPDRSAGQAAIGDVGRYTVVIDVPEGTQRALTLDEVLPSGLSLVPGSLVLAPDSDFTAADLPEAAAASTSAGAFTWPLGTVVNAHTDGTPRAVRIQYDALVQNLASVTAGAPPGTSAATVTLGAPGTASSPAPAALSATAPGPVVVEPALTVADAIAPAMPVPGGTTLTVQVTIRHAAGSTAPARDVAYALTLPSSSLSPPAGAAFTQNPAGCSDPQTVGQSVSFTCSRIDVGQVEVLSFQTTVPTTSTIASQFALSAAAAPVLTWMSVPGATRVDGAFVARTGSSADPGGTANTYLAQDATQIQVTPTAATKTLSGATTRTIGEGVDWDVSLGFPVGTTTAAMVDALPAGLVFVPGSEATVVNPDPATLTWENGGGTALPPAVLTSTNHTATWSLGTTTHLAGGAGALAVRVHARVEDVAGNKSGTVLAANTFTPPGGSAISADHAITVIEPSLTVATTASPGSSPDAGNVITWTTTISHVTGASASTATAYDVALRYVLPAKLVTGGGDLSGCPAGQNAAVTPGTAGGYPSVDITLDALPLGQSCKVTWTTTVASTVLPNEQLVYPATGRSFTWHSLPHATAGGAERTYGASTLPTQLSPTFRVVNFGRSKALSAGQLATAAVGEPVHYTISVTVPEAAPTTLTVVDTLPKGMEFVSATTSVSDPVNLVCAPTACTSVAPTIGGTLSATTSRTATWSFAGITNQTTGTGNLNRTLTIDVTARIADIAGNGGSITTYQNQVAAGGASANAPTVTLVEPALDVALSPSATTADGGDTITWTATLTETKATAYDVAVHYAFPGHLGAGAGAVVSCPTGASPAVSVVPSGGSTLVDLTLASLAVGTCKLTFTTPLDAALQAGEVLAPLPGQTVQWRSQPHATANGLERIYAPALAAPATIVVPDVSIAKALTSAATAAIGQPVRYRLSVVVPETGGTPLVVTDTLPSGMQLVGATLDLSAGGLACSPNPCAAVTPAESGTLGAGSHLVETWDFGTVSTTGNTASLGTRSLAIDVTARIADLPANGTTLTSYLNAASAHGVSAAPPAAVALVEPAVTVALSPSTTTADAGDTVTWTATFTGATATAYELAAHYLLAGHLGAGALASSTCGGGAVAFGASGGSTVVDLSATSLAPGASCAIRFTTPLDPAVQAGEALAPAAGQTLRWRSQPDASAGGAERTSTVTPTAPATVRVPALTIAKARRLPADTGVSVGEAVVYRISIGVPEGKTPGVQLADTLPAGLRHVSAQLVNPSGALACTPSCADGIALTPTVAGQTATFDLGEVRSTSTSTVPTTSTLAVDVTAVVDAIAANRAGTIIGPNVAQVQSTLSAPATAGSGDQLTVEEPALVVTSIGTDASGPDAGNTVTFTATLDTPPGATLVAPFAYDVALHAVLPGNLVPGSIDLTGCTGASSTPASEVIDSAGADTVADLVLDSLVLPASGCALRFRVILGPDVAASELLGLDPVRSAFTYRSAPGGGRSYGAAVPAASFTAAPLQLSSALASAATAAVGDTVLYDLTVAVPEGATAVSLAETLPAGLAFQSATIRNAGGLTCAPAACADGAPILPATSAGNALTFNLGTVTNPGALPTTSRRALTVRLAATVADVAGNAGGTTLAQNAVATAGLTSWAPGVQLVEPRLAASATASTTAVDARDPVTYAVTLSQPGATADAYDVHLRYPLHARLGASALDASGCPDGVNVTTSSAGGAADVRMDRLPLGKACVLRFTVAPTDAVEAGEALAPPADGALSWSSAPASTTAPRAYAAVPSPLATLQVADLSLAKVRIGGATQLSVGDSVVYRVSLGLPEGTTTGVALTDTLPAGLRFGSARIVNPGDAACTPACADGAAVSPALSGQDATFDLGTVATLANISSARTRTLALEVTAVVDAVPGNTAGATIGANAAVARSTRSRPAEASSGDSFVVGEPALSVRSVTSDAPSPDAGNTVTFTATLASPAAANLSPVAYGVQLHVTLPGALKPGAIDLSGCPGATATAGRQTVTASDGATLVDVVLDTLALPITSCALRFSAVLGPEVVAGETLSLDDALSRSWLRYASAPVGGVTYTAPVPACGFAVAPLSASAALATAARAPVGGLVRYDLTVHVPEGNGTVVLDETLPDGLAFRSAALSTAASLRCAPVACPDGASVAPTSVSGQRLTFDLGTVTNSGAATTTVARDLTVQVTAAVADAAGNRAGAALAANASSLNGGPALSAPGVALVEPALTAHVALDPPGAVDAGDDVAVSTTVSNAWSADGADAYDLDVVLDLPPELRGRPGTIVASGACAVDEAASGVTDAQLRFRVDHLPSGAVLGTTSDCTLTAVLRPTDAATFGRSYAALATSALTWASTAGPNADRRDGSLATPLDDYRTSLGFAVAISTATDLAKAFVAGSSGSPLTDDPSLALGETATYRVRLALPEGTSPDVVVTDTPPRGLRIVAVAMDPDPSQGCTAPTCAFRDPTAVVDGTAGEAHAFDLGTVVIPGTAAEGGALSLLVTVQAVPDPGLAPLSVNTVALDVGGADTGARATSPVAIVLGAPAVTLAVDPPAPKGGDTVHVTAAIENRGAGPVCDPHLAVALPPALTAVAPGALTLALPPGTCIAAGGRQPLTLDARLADDAPPQAIAVTATLGGYASLPAGGVTFDPATDGVDSNGDGRADEAGDPVATVELLPVAPRLRFTKAAAVAGGGPLRPGGTITYTLRVENSGTLPAREVVITDPLPLADAEYDVGSEATTQGTVAVAAGSLSARLGDVAPGAPAEVQVRLRVKDPVSTAEPLANQATLATGDGYGGRRSDDPSTPAADDPTIVPIARDPACATDSDCLRAEWCDADAHACRPDLPHGGGTCQPGAPHAGAQCNCDPRLPASSCLPPGVDACDPRDGVCGLVNGSPCAGLGDAVCRSLVCNPDGRCGDPDGAACDPSASPNLTCRSGVCDSGTRRCGLPPGEPCVAARQCRSKVCGADGKCGDLNGTPCADAATCRSEVCNADGHCGDPLGTPCATGATCRSNTCDAGRCVEPCGGDEACAAGFYCEPTARLCRPARGPGEACDASHGGRDCAAGACGADGRCGLDDGAACTAALACRGASCAAGRCGACGDDADCAADRFCDPAGHACVPRLENGADCPLGAVGDRACRAGLCAADGKCGTAAGLACSSAADCRSGLCTEAGVCAAQGCAVDDDCRWDDHCDPSGACVPRRENGAACDRAAMCASAICDAGTCGAPDRAPCDVLSPSPQCRSAACNPDDDACGLTGGQACAAPTECRVGVCDAGDGACGLPPGAACAGDDVCRSQTCLAGTCTLCTSDDACGADGFCDYPAGQCAPRRPPTAPCDRGAQCTRNVCSSAGTCVGGFQDGVGVSGSACSSAGQAPAWAILAGVALLAIRRRRRPT